MAFIISISIICVCAIIGALLGVYIAQKGVE